MRVRVAPFVALSLLMGQSSSLMFQSDVVTSQWDTWAFVENGTFYAYYLITEHSPGEGFGVASSPNGVTDWTDHGYVWHSPDWADHQWWEGTGAIWRAPDFNKTGRYIINYSRCPGKYQQITFAESYDLIHWARPAPFNETYFNITLPYYKNPGRWDCIYSTPQTPAVGSPRDGYPRYGWWTASAVGDGDMGFGTTEDGYTWSALPSPTMIPPIGSEVGAVEYITSASGKGAAWFAMLGHGGMLVYSSPNATGPFTQQPKNPSVLSGSCYFSRFFRKAEGDTVYVTHQSFSHQGRTYIAPYKTVEVDDEGVLRFKYFDTGGVLDGAPLVATANATAPWYSHTANVSVGAVVGWSLTLPDSATSATAEEPAVIVEMAGGGATVLSLDAAGRCTVASAVFSAAGTANITRVLGTWDRELSLQLRSSVAVRLLYRRDMLELYLDDYLLPITLMPEAGTGRLGILPNVNAHLLQLAFAVSMNLPGTGTWPPLPPPSPPPPPPPLPPGDLSPQGTASCSGVYSSHFDCKYGTDGNIETRWSSALPYDGATQWLAAHFTTPVRVSHVGLSWELAYAKGYSLQVANSTAGSEVLVWTTFYNTTSGSGKVENITNIGIMVGTNFRILCTERFTGSQWGYSLYEFELYA